MSIGLFSLFFFLIYCYALSMNQFAVIRLCFVIPFLLTAVISPTPLYAQRKVPRKIFKKSPAPRIDKIVGEFITPAELRALQKERRRFLSRAAPICSQKSNRLNILS